MQLLQRSFLSLINFVADLQSILGQAGPRRIHPLDPFVAREWKDVFVGYIRMSLQNETASSFRWDTISFQMQPLKDEALKLGHSSSY